MTASSIVYTFKTLSQVQYVFIGGCLDAVPIDSFFMLHAEPNILSCVHLEQSEICLL